MSASTPAPGPGPGVAADVADVADVERRRRDPATFFHIGIRDAGGSWLHDTFDRNRDVLSAAGVHYLEGGTRAVSDALGERDTSEDDAGAWQRLVRQAQGAPSPTRLLSVDRLSAATDDQVRAVVAAFAPDPVEIILTVGDIARLIAVAWQTAVRNGSTTPFPDYVGAVTGMKEDQGAGDRFWRQHDTGVILRRWAPIVGAENVHVVIVPPAGAPSGLLLDRFLSALGVDVTSVDLPTDRGESSLSYSNAELLRKLNRRVGASLGRRNYNRYLRSFIADEVMGSSAPGGGPDEATLSPAAHAWAVDYSDTLIADLQLPGIHLWGEVAELIPPSAPQGSSDAPRVIYPDTAVRAIAMLLRKLIEIDPAAAPPEARARHRRESRGTRHGSRKNVQRGST